MKRGFQPRMSGCKGKDGSMIGEEGKTLERWKEYFTEMLTEDNDDKGDTEDYRRNLMAKPDHGLFEWTSNSIKELNRVMVCQHLSLY